MTRQQPKHPFELEAEDIARIIMQSSDKIYAWIFVALDETGHPCLFSNMNGDIVHDVLIKLGHHGKENSFTTEDIFKDTKQ